MTIQNSAWKALLQEEFQQPYFLELCRYLDKERQQYTLYPPDELIFSAFEPCSPEDIKVVIVGQDPYHGAGQANGLSFSVNEGVRVPPSLRNIFKEIEQDLGRPAKVSGDLGPWAQQGVFLLNAVLSVREGSPGAHRKKGWERFTDAVLRRLSEKRKGLVFLLWGNYAQEKGAVIDTKQHFVLTSAHPSPFSAKRFFGNHHFSQANQYLVEAGKTPIQW